MSGDRPQSAAKAVSLVAIISMASQIFGFARSMLLASVFGTGFEMDAYNMATGLVGILPVVLTAYIGSTYIPEYALARSEGESEASRFYSLVMTISLAVSVVIAAAGFVFAGKIVMLFAPGFEDGLTELTVRLFRIAVCTIPAQIAVSVWGSTLNARRAHVIPALAGMSLNLFVIPAALLLTGFFGIWAIIWAFFFSVFFQGFVLFGAVFRQGQRYRVFIDIKDSRLKKTIRLAVPSIAASATWQVNSLVDRTLSSGLPSGSVSSLEYAVRLAGFIPSIIFTPFIAVFLPRMSERAANRDRTGALGLLWRTVEILLAVSVPVCVITVFMRVEIVRIIFERGVFGGESTERVGTVLMAYIWYTVIVAVSEPLSSAFLAWQDTRGMMLRGVLSVAVNAVSSIVLARWFGILGIVLGTLLGGAVFALALLISLRRRWGPLGLLRTMLEVLKMVFCAAACGLIVWLLRKALPASDGTVIMDVLRFGAAAACGGAAYLAAALLMRVRSVKEVVGLVMGKVKSIAGGARRGS